MDLIEGVGESSSPPPSFGNFSSYDIRNDVYNRLLESANDEALCNPEFREHLDAHFNRLPNRCCHPQFLFFFIVFLFNFVIVFSFTTILSRQMVVFDYFKIDYSVFLLL